MFKRLFVIGLFFAISNAAYAINSKYELTLDNEAASTVRIASVMVQASEDVTSEAKMYDSRDVENLSGVLRKKVELYLTKKDLMAADGLQLVITITDLKPNRPTLAQYRSKPGIDFRSIALGGASLDAKFITPDGTEVGSAFFKWEESWIDQVSGASTWYDARKAFDRFARRLSRDLATDTQIN